MIDLPIDRDDDTGDAPGGGLARIWMPTGIDAGTLGEPSSKDDVILMVDIGTGWTIEGGTTVRLWNCNTNPVVGAKIGWAVPRADGTYELFKADK